MRRLTLASRTAFKTDTHFYYSYFNSFLEAATVKHLSSDVAWVFGEKKITFLVSQFDNDVVRQALA